MAESKKKNTLREVKEVVAVAEEAAATEVAVEAEAAVEAEVEIAKIMVADQTEEEVLSLPTTRKLSQLSER